MSEESKLYYNSIASEYDDIMNMHPINKCVRNIVEKKIKSIVTKNSKILDFGGGTGEDLHWLSKNYNVTFLEPSEEMRNVAYKKALDNNYNEIQFVKASSTLFENFTSSSFTKKFDAIIANFAVINSIKDLNLLSNKMALICEENCDLFFVVLYRLPDLKSSYLKDKLHDATFKNKTFSKNFEIKNKTVKSKIYIHSLKYLKKNFQENFRFVNAFHISDSYFKIIHLKK